VKETKSARAWRGFSESAVAVASNGSGDLLVVRDGSTEIELWEHETGNCAPVSIDWTQP
jgi:hypothetical protein